MKPELLQAVQALLSSAHYSAAYLSGLPEHYKSAHENAADLKTRVEAVRAELLKNP